MTKARRAFACSVAGLIAAVLLWVGGYATRPTPVSRADALQLYEVLLREWGAPPGSSMLLDERLEPAPDPADEDIADCLEGVQFGLGMQPALDTLHGVTFERKGVQLIDGATWHADDQQLEANVARGMFEDADFERAFAHALYSLSHIQFDRSARFALLSSSHVCGELCGSGWTALLEKRGNEWKIRTACRHWLA